MKVLAIALNTSREAIRNRILYSIVFFAVVVACIAAVFGAASVGDHMKFVKDFSLMSISLFGVIIAITLGVNLLNKELGKKTIFNILSKPVSRWQFILGKFAGLLATLVVVVTLMCAGLIAIAWSLDNHFDWGLVLASGTALLELMVITSIALFFSAGVVTPTLAGLFTAAAFVAGRSAKYLRYFWSNEHSAGVQSLAHSLYWIIPHLDQFNISDLVVYGNVVQLRYVVTIAAYAVGYSTVMLALSVAFFTRREFV